MGSLRYVDSFLAEVGRDVRRLDYRNLPEWQDPSLYFNSFFMNAKGRRKFTRNVMQTLGLCLGNVRMQSAHSSGAIATPPEDAPVSP